MKKVLVRLLTLLIIWYCLSGFKVSGDYYVLTDDNIITDNYVLSHLEDFLSTQEDLLAVETVCVGTGINVYGTQDYNQVIYPISVGGIVRYALEVFSDSDGIGGALSENYVALFNKTLPQTERNKPLQLFVHEGVIVGKIGESVYAIDGIEINKECFDIKFEASGERRRLESLKRIKGSEIKSGSGYCSWTVYYSNNSTSFGIYCGAISLWNLQKNMGYNYFSSYTGLATDISNTLGIGPCPYLNYSNITSYLCNKSYSYGCSSNGYMTVSEINTMTYTNHRYGLAFSKTSSSGSGHVTAIIGYSTSSSGNYAILFDPHGSGNCRITLDLSSRWFTSLGTSYKWDYGYIKNIYHS